MTLVVGGVTPAGQAFMIGDTRVTFPDHSKADLVRKVYWLGRDMIGGFSGSVRIGFDLLTSLASYLRPDDETGIWIPEGVAREWAGEAAKRFASHDDSERKWGCSILLAAVSPHDNGPFPRTVLIRLNSPTFEPTRLGNFGGLQLGSGRDFQPYQEWAQQHFSDPRLLLSFGTLGTSIGSILAHSLSETIRDMPTSGVSPHLHVVSCVRGQRSEGTTSYQFSDGTRILMPSVASSYRAYCELASELGKATAAAVA